MNLTEQDRSDLMGLISGFGTPQSDARAHHLVEVRPEAAEFVRQMKTIAKAFSLPQTEGARMHQQDAAALAADIRVKAASRENDWGEGEQPRRRWHPAWAVVAAAMVFLALGTTWIVLRTHAHSTQDSPYVIFLSHAPPAADAVSNQTRERLTAGDQIRTKKDVAVLVFADGTRGVIQWGSDVILGREDHTIILNAGEVFVYSPGEMKVLGGDTVTELYTVKAHLTASERRLTWSVYEGIVLITIHNQTYKVIAGHSAVWTTMDNAVHIQPSKDAIPAWAVKGLDVPADP